MGGFSVEEIELEALQGARNVDKEIRDRVVEAVRDGNAVSHRGALHILALNKLREHLRFVLEQTLSATV